MNLSRLAVLLCLTLCPALIAPALAAEGARPASHRPQQVRTAKATPELSGIMDVDWLAARLDDPLVRIIDCRPQPEYNKGHIPGSVSLNPESLRGNVGGAPSMLLPNRMLAQHFGLLGVTPRHILVFVHGDKVFDATLEAMAAASLRHSHYVVLSGGFPAWKAAGKPVDTRIPRVTQGAYRAPLGPNAFEVDTEYVHARLSTRTPIIDVRENVLYTGEKSDDARAGHIPGALNRPLADDLVKQGEAVFFKPLDELEKAYAAVAPDKRAEIIVHCRTGREASQTYFLLTALLGYSNVKFYDEGWTVWSARPELPIETGEGRRF